MKKSILLNALLKYIIIFFFAQDAFCQIPINVIESNKLDQIKIHDTIFQKFSGDVIIAMINYQRKNDRSLQNTHTHTRNVQLQEFKLRKSKQLNKE